LKQGEIINFRESGFGVWKWEIFSGKGKICEIFQKVQKFVENRGNLKQGENASWPQGDGRPVATNNYLMID